MEMGRPRPGCGGTDRFALNKELGIFNCRRFGGGDTIAMVRHALGLDFVEAVEFIVGSSLRRGSARRPSAAQNRQGPTTKRSGSSAPAKSGARVSSPAERSSSAISPGAG